MKKSFLFLAVGLFVSAAVSATEKTVYLEEFDRLGDYVASFNEGASISEWPASLKHLFFNPGKMSDARTGYFPVTTPPREQDYTIFFRFMMTRDADRAFALKFYFGKADNPEVHTVTIAETGSCVDGTPPAPSEGMGGFLPSWKWNKGAIVVNRGKVSLYLYRNGVLTLEGGGSFPRSPLIGWNLSSSSPVCIDSVRIVDGCVRPYMIGDPVSWIGAASQKPRKAGIDDVALANGETVAFKPEEGSDICFEYLTGAVNVNARNAIDFVFADGKTATVNLSIPKASKNVNIRTYNAAKGAFVGMSTNVPLPDQRISVQGPGVAREVYVSPKLDYRYEDPELVEFLMAWDKFPKASEHRLSIRLRPQAPDWSVSEVWIDAKYAGTLQLPAAPTGIRAHLAEGASLVMHPVRDETNIFADTRFLPLDVAGLGRPYGTVPPFTALPDIQTVPYRFAAATSALNLAYCRENLGSFALECNGNLSKSPFDGMPSAMQFSVPVDQYVRAYALCAVDPNAPADFEPVVTARLTHYFDNGGRSQAACECTRRLPAKGQALPEGVTAFGEAAGGVPVYQVAFDFDIGSIQDLTSMLKVDRLDLEFIGSLWDKDTYYLDRRRSPSYEKQSSVQIYAATLERTPCKLIVTPNRKNSMYYPDETAGATVLIVPFESNLDKIKEAGGFSVTVAVTNDSGKEVESIAFNDESMRKQVAFKTTDFGHYNVVYTVRDGAGKPVVTHRGAFVRLPADTRKAGYESPYYVWNFRGAHGTPSQLNDWGDMLLRMGIRRTLLPDNLSETSPEVQRYKLTQGEFPYLRLKRQGKQTDEEAFEALKQQMRDRIAKNPHCGKAIIFHESGNGPFPKELIGGKTVVTPDVAKADTNRMNEALVTARAWREVDPDVRLIIGNSGYALGILGQIFRAGFPADLIDAMGDESVGMTQPPERSVAYPAWMLREVARLYGYTNAVPDAPWEWKSRVVRHLGEELQAAFCIRSALIAHAWCFTCIPMNGLTEMANSYYDTIWGDSSFTRWPLAYPQQTAAAMATITLILDQAEFVRMVPTGSLTAYALEFRRPDGKYVYAIWTARAESEVTFDAGGNTKITHTDMRGYAHELKDGEKLTASEVPFYLTVDSPVGAFSVVNRTRPSRDICGGLTIVQPLESDDEAEIVGGVDKRIDIAREDPPQSCFFRPGTFEISASKDEPGALQLTRKPSGDCPEIMQEYTFLKFPKAKPVAGTASTIGVWVKGNSSWGKLYFEIVDAEGEKWLSAGSGGYGCVVYDWPEKAAINFDGWRFVQMPLTKESPVKIYCPGENEGQWQRDGEFGNGKIDFPITVTGLGVGMYPHVLNLVEMEESSPSILLKDLSVY